MIVVCTACGKVKDEHRGWDVSCEINSVEVEEEQVLRDNVSQRVIQILAPDSE